MKNSWTKTFRRLAAGAVVAGATTLSSAMCYAQAAFDSAIDPAYIGGWLDGSNGGVGFTPWDFTGSYGPDPNNLDTNISKYGDMQAIDEGTQTGGQGFSEFNNIAKAWTLFNPIAVNVGDDNPPSRSLGQNSDIARAGRGFSFGALQPGDTLSMVVDNPTERRHYGGYIIRFYNSPNDGNSCFAGYNCTTFAAAGENTTRLTVGTFDFAGSNNWFVGDDSSPLSPEDTNGGLQIAFTLTGSDTYSVTLTPLASPGDAFTGTGTLLGSGPINRFQFELFNTDSDFYPTEIANRAETDFYISSMSVVPIPEPGTGVLLVLGAGTLLGLGTARRRKGV